MKRHLPFHPIAAAPCIHTYFDVVPESPDGNQIVYFRFDGVPLTRGTIFIQERGGKGPATEVLHCAGTAHEAAQQGWLDDQHIYFTADGQVQIANLQGEIVQRFPGAIDTIHQQTRRGLAPSKNWRGENRPPKEKACYRIDIDSASLCELMDLDQAWELCRGHLDLDRIDKSLMNFKHTKWSPDGRRWSVVFTNEEQRKAHPGLQVVKVLLSADDRGGNACFVSAFRHHPNWSPDGRYIYAFAGAPGEVHAWDLQGGTSRVLCTFPGEGHPCMHPRGIGILTDSYEQEDMAVYWMPFQTGEVVEIARSPDPKVAWQTSHPPQQLCHVHPVWSHDGERIYANRVVGHFPQLMVMHPWETLPP